ncbi:Mono- and diacylglycerol lipase [Porphyridium purpureum]|uniref:Mono-and diacylglycerol lipase n=1 Tax=Porphyridium purpureum TaxID=35688 RepID=A0A5J4YNH9_PORPP|nr:Mono- and diacylglycerol lipase [Porphyridium purpureum]|eukprot:POR0328..scf249_10
MDTGVDGDVAISAGSQPKAAVEVEHMTSSFEQGLMIAEVIEQDRRRAVLWYFQIMNNRSVLLFTAFILTLCALVVMACVSFGIIAATTKGSDEHVASVARTLNEIENAIILVVLSLILVSTISYGIIVFFLLPRDRKLQDASSLASLNGIGQSDSLSSSQNLSLPSGVLVGRDFDSIEEMHIIQSMVCVLVFIASVACLVGFSLLHVVAGYWIQISAPVYDALISSLTNAYFYVYVWATADLAVLALDPDTGLQMSLKEYYRKGGPLRQHSSNMFAATDSLDSVDGQSAKRKRGELGVFGTLFWALMWDKVVFFVIFSAVLITLELVFRIDAQPFSWHGWIVLIRVAIDSDSGIILNAGRKSGIALACVLNIFGLAVYLAKAYSAARILKKQPFFVHSKRTLYFRFTFFETVSVWFVTVFSIMFFQTLIMPLTGPAGLFQYDPATDILYVTSGLGGGLTLLPLAIWVLSLTIMFLPATYPGVKSLFRFKRVPVEESLQDANKRARFTLDNGELLLGTVSEKAQAACEPHVFCWRYAELSYNFAKLAYAPVSLGQFEGTRMNPTHVSSAAVRQTVPAHEQAKVARSEDLDAQESRVLPGAQSLQMEDSEDPHALVYMKSRMARALNSRLHKRSGFAVVADIENRNSGIRVVVFRHGANDQVAIAFRGTVSMKDLETDIQSKMGDLLSKWDTNVITAGGAVRASSSLLDQLVLSLERIQNDHKSDSKTSGVAPEQIEEVLRKLHSDRWVGVHSGFLCAYLSVRSVLMDALLPLLAAGPLRPVLICGHSLGGALSVLLAFDLMVCQLIPAGSLYCMTFGSPKLGSPLFAQAMRVLLPNMFRVVFVGDPVTKIPRRDFMGLLGKKFSHTGHLVLISQNGALLLTPSIVEKVFTHRVSFDINRHRMATYAQGLNAFASSFGSSFDVWTHTFNDVVEEDERSVSALKLVHHV